VTAADDFDHFGSHFNRLSVMFARHQSPSHLDTTAERSGTAEHIQNTTKTPQQPLPGDEREGQKGKDIF